jgi:hypothetical protein
MAETIYRILPQADSTFAVDIIEHGAIRGSVRRGAFGFINQSDAEGWIVQEKRYAARRALNDRETP